MDKTLSFEEKMARVEWLSEQARWAAKTLPQSGTCIVDDETAIMDRQYFSALGEYSCSLPSGTYIGKRWKRNTNGVVPHWKCSACQTMFSGFGGNKPCTQPGCDGHLNLFEKPPEWWMGEFYDIGKKDEVGIKWRKIILT